VFVVQSPPFSILTSVVSSFSLIKPPFLFLVSFCIRLVFHFVDEMIEPLSE
jgi:hypothetical protein